MPFKIRAFIVWTFTEVVAILIVLWRQGVLG